MNSNKLQFITISLGYIIYFFLEIWPRLLIISWAHVPDQTLYKSFI